MYSVLALIVFANGILAQSESLLGQKISFELIPGGKMAVANSGTQVAVTGRFQTQLFVLSDNTWSPPVVVNRGYYGSESDPRRTMASPMYAWVVEPNETEVFVISFDDRFAVTAQDGILESKTTQADYSFRLTDPTGRLLTPLTGLHEQYLAAKKSKYSELKGEDVDRPGFASNRRSVDLPETLYGIADFSPQRDRVLCRPEKDDPLLVLNLVTGEQIPFYIQNDRPRALPGDMSGSFSPDGEYVLMQYSYGPDDHYAGGYLQLFTKDGKFVEEVAEFHKDVAMPVGFHEWLHNNWIVYSTGKEIVFKKFVGPPTESER